RATNNPELVSLNRSRLNRGNRRTAAQSHHDGRNRVRRIRRTERVQAAPDFEHTVSRDGIEAGRHEVSRRRARTDRELKGLVDHFLLSTIAESYFSISNRI